MSGTFDEEYLQEIERKRKEWETGPLKQSLDRFGATVSPNKFYTPLDVREFDFLANSRLPPVLIPVRCLAAGR